MQPHISALDTDVSILGAGVTGLTTGIKLLESLPNCTVTAHAERTVGSDCRVAPITSNAACAIWLPIWTADEKDSPPDYGARLSRWCDISLQKFSELADVEGNPFGITWVTNYELYESLTEAPDFVQRMPEFSEGYQRGLPDSPHPHNYVWTFRTPVIETPIYLKRLRDQFVSMGGRIATERVFGSLDDILRLDSEIIFNCLGLGSRDIFEDQDLVGKFGQLLLLPHCDIDYAIGAGDYCLIPRSDHLIFGSLFLPWTTGDHITPKEEATTALFDTIIRWSGKRVGKQLIQLDHLKFHDVECAVSGVRPYRASGVRIEKERIAMKTIIHNYGHGGGGVTLSWGCAAEAISLL
jgi:D-amino-acid oxidase